MDAEMYGMMPMAKIEAWLKAPPANVSIKPRIPFVEPCAKFSVLIPGNTMCVPIRYIKIRSRVYSILLRRSSLLQIFLNVLIRFFTEDKSLRFAKHILLLQYNQIYFTTSTEPPAVSMADFAFSLIAFTLKVSLAFNSPLAKIFTRSV